MLAIDAQIPLLALHVGRVAGLGRHAVQSGIDKRSCDGRVLVTRQGLAGDEQANRRHHGGTDKALHHYPAQHYAYWRAALPTRAARFVPGGFGENQVTVGVSEADVCLGDIFLLGSARVQIAQGRHPCVKLNLRFDVADMRKGRWPRATRCACCSGRIPTGRWIVCGRCCSGPSPCRARCAD